MELISKPVNVRGLGNVIELRSSEKYICNHSVTSDSTATIGDETYSVIVMGSAGDPVYFTYSIPELKQGVTTNVTFNLKSVSNNTNISGASIGYYVNGELSTTGTTNSRGNVTFTIPTSSFGSFELSLKYNGSGTYAKKIETINVVVKRKVKYTFVKTTEVRSGVQYDKYTATCLSFDTNEPVDGVYVLLIKDGTEEPLDSGYTNSDGIYSMIYAGIRPTTVTATYSKEDHYFVEA